MIALHAKSYYMCDAYPALFAAGAVALERATRQARFIRPAVVAVAALAGFALIPLVLPVLPVEQFTVYQAGLSKVLPLKSLATEHHRQSVLPQTYADMYGWPQLAQTVADVYASLPVAREVAPSSWRRTMGMLRLSSFLLRPELPVSADTISIFFGVRADIG